MAFNTCVTPFIGITPISFMTLSVLTNMRKDIPIVVKATEPNAIGIERTPIPATDKPSFHIALAKVEMCFFVSFSVDFAIFPSALPKSINEIDIADITADPRAMAAAIGSIPITPIATANNPIKAAIIPNCFQETPFVASVIFLSAIPNRIKDTLITNMTSDPINTFFFALFNILNVELQILTIPTITSAPNNAGMASTATTERNTAVTIMSPVNAASISAEPIAFLISLLLFESFFATDMVLVTIFDKSFAPHNAG